MREAYIEYEYSLPAPAVYESSTLDFYGAPHDDRMVASMLT